MRSGPILLVLGLLASSACGGSTTNAAAPGDDGGGSPDGESDVGVGPPDGGVDSTVDSGAETGTDASNDAAADSNVPDVIETTDAGPITGLPTEQWTWVPFPESHCRDGSTTGIGVNYNPASTKLMIFLEGGGACFDTLTCGMNPSAFGASDFMGWQGSSGVSGIFARNDTANAVKDWSFVYVPYCTGDVHAGNNPTGLPKGITTPQLFLGYLNVGLFLMRVVPTFAGATQVLLTGISAGGFGAAANYDQVQQAFGSVPVDLLDDSGPFMGSPYVATCLQDEWQKLWGLDRTILTDCGSDCPDHTDYLIPYAKHIAALHPSRMLGLMDSTDDNTITFFFGFGANNCTSLVPLSAQTFTAGLMDIRTQLASDPNAGSFFFTGTDHTTLEGSNFDTRTAGTVKLTDWITQLVGGSITNAGP